MSQPVWDEPGVGVGCEASKMLTFQRGLNPGSVTGGGGGGRGGAGGGAGGEQEADSMQDEVDGEEKG